MVADLCAPLVPAECDLRGMEWLPLYGGRLFGSDFDAHASDAEFRAGMQLWWAAWNQVPAASLPDDDVALCRLAGMGRDLKAWKKLKARALHGFVLCSDGRLYHRALASFACESWARRLKDRDRKAKWREERERRASRDGTRTETGTERGQGTGQNAEQGWDRTTDETRRDEMRRDATRRDATSISSSEVGEGASAPPQPAKRGMRLPEDWTVSDDGRAFATELKLNPDTVAAAFKDYWRAASGSTARKLDWDAAFRTWCRRQSDQQPSQRVQAGESWNERRIRLGLEAIRQ